MQENTNLWKDTSQADMPYQPAGLFAPTGAVFDNLVSLACNICGVAIAGIAVAGKRWSGDTGWVPSFYQEILPLLYTDHSGEQEDFASVQEDFISKHTLPAGNTTAGFLAAIRLRDSRGECYGYLYIADPIAKELTAGQRSSLTLLAGQVSALLELHAGIVGHEREDTPRVNGEQMHMIFRNAMDAVVVTDEAGIILHWNPRAETIFGWKEHEVAGKLFHKIVFCAPNDARYRSDLAHYMRQDLGSPAANRHIELSACRKNKESFEAIISVSAPVDQDGCFFINFIRDVTERKLATEKLDEQKEFYENILNELPTDIAVFDPAHKYLFVNPGAIKDPELRKYIVGKDDFEYAEYRNRPRSVAQIRRDQFMQVKDSGKEIRWEDTVNDPNGQPVTHLRRLFPVHDEQGALKLVIGFGIDITERKMMEEKQTLLVSQLSAQNTQLIDFCNIVSHNLRGPLVNMSMLVDFIEESEDRDEQSMLVGKLKPVLDHLHTTFNELVESIQIKQDLEVESEHTSLALCMQRTIEGLKTEIISSGAIIETDFAAPEIYYPPKYLFSIFYNLVSNTLKYQSPDRKLLLSLATKKENNSIILSVTDNGLGIDLMKHKENIFKIGKVFHRHPNAKGFGLFMTRTQVEAMDGRIWAESTPGKGSTFFVEFKNQKP